MRVSFATVLPLGLSLCLGPALGAQCESQCTQQNANPAVTESAGKAPVAPMTQLAKKIADLSPEKRKIAREAFRNLTASCPLGRRTPKTILALQNLYSEASSSLTKVASAKDIDPSFKAGLDKQITVIGKLAKINGATIAVMKQLAGKSECCAEDTETVKTDGACEGQGDGQEACGDKTELVAEKPKCNISFANSLVSDWGKGMKEFTAMPAESKAKLQASFKVLDDLGLRIPQFISMSLKKQGALLGEAIGSMSCPKSGLVATNAEILDHCKTTKAAVGGAGARLAAAHKLLMAVPFVKKQPASSDEECTGSCPSMEESSEGCPSKNGGGECSEAKAETKQGGCPSKTKTVKN